MAINRRRFLKDSALAFGGVMMSPTLLRNAMAQGSDFSGKTVITLFLRGGADGLQSIFPTGPTVEPSQIEAYKFLRNANDGSNNLLGFIPSIERTGAPGEIEPLQLNDYFEMHPALANLLPAYTDGKLAILPAVGNAGSRSHFQAEDGIEAGTPFVVNGMKTNGWMHDALDQLLLDDPANLNSRLTGGISFGSSVATSLQGTAQAGSIVAMRSIDGFNLNIAGEQRTVLSDIYSLHLNDFGRFKQSGSSVLSIADNVNLLQSDYAATLQNSFSNTSAMDLGFAKNLASITTLIKNGNAPAFCNVNVGGGWDTHNNEWPRLNGLFSKLASGINEFYLALSPAELDNVCLVVLSEFGRTLDVNGNLGADHGNGGTWFVLGGTVDGGKVFADQWPGLPLPEKDENGNIVYAAENIPKYQADITGGFTNSLTLAGKRPIMTPGTDFRSVYRSVLEDFVGLSDITTALNLSPQELVDIPKLGLFG